LNEIFHVQRSPIFASKCPACNLAFTIDEIGFRMAPYMEGIGYLASFVYQDRTGDLEFIPEFYQILLFFFDGYSVYNYVCVP